MTALFVKIMSRSCLSPYRLEVKNKNDEIHFLSDTLAREQKNSLQLQWALEKENAKSGHHEKWEKEELEVSSLHILRILF